MTKYYALLTNLGAAKLANAAALGTKLQITQMAVGDGGGTLPTPNASQTALVAEKRRAALNGLSVDAANSSQIIAEQIIPEGDGGFWIREIGLFDADGVMIAVANCPETYKPQLQEGSGRTQTVRMILIVNSTEAVTLKIDPSVVLATRKYVDDNAIEVKAYADSLMAKHLAAADPHTQYAPKASPAFTGRPIAPTAARLDDSAQLATTAHVKLVVGAYAPLDSPGLTGRPIAPTAAKADNSLQLATTAHVKSVVGDYALLNSPVFSGTPTAPTAAAGNNSQQMANTAFVQAAIAALVAGSPAALDTLKELANALGGDENFAATMLNKLSQKQQLDATLTALSGRNVPALLQYLGLQDLTGVDTSNNKWSWKLPNGIIFQILKPTASNATTPNASRATTVNFPVAFPSECFAVFVCKTSYVNVVASAESVTRTSCDVVTMPLDSPVVGFSVVTLLAVGR
ncbi:phage tail protein [Erwinia sp. Eh17-17]|uniref:phage tail protein n=1 Tax=Erwinia sp. Eh17-17 TaxID=3080330 RepID=UPI0032088260